MNVCGFRFERGEEGYQVGAYMFNIIAAELLFAFLFAASGVHLAVAALDAARVWGHPDDGDRAVRVLPVLQGALPGLRPPLPATRA